MPLKYDNRHAGATPERRDRMDHFVDIHRDPVYARAHFRTLVVPLTPSVRSVEQLNFSRSRTSRVCYGHWLGPSWHVRGIPAQKLKRIRPPFHCATGRFYPHPHFGISADRSLTRRTFCRWPRPWFLFFLNACLRPKGCGCMAYWLWCFGVSHRKECLPPGRTQATGACSVNLPSVLPGLNYPALRKPVCLFRQLGARHYRSRAAIYRREKLFSAEKVIHLDPSRQGFEILSNPDWRLFRCNEPS